MLLGYCGALGQTTMDEELRNNPLLISRQRSFGRNNETELKVEGGVAHMNEIPRSALQGAHLLGSTPIDLRKIARAGK